LAKIGVIDLVDLEVEPTERLADRSGVVNRVGQFGRMLVRPDADHERHAPLRRRWRLRKAPHRDDCEQQYKQEPLHLADNLRIAPPHAQPGQFPYFI